MLAGMFKYVMTPKGASGSTMRHWVWRFRCGRLGILFQIAERPTVDGDGRKVERQRDMRPLPMPIDHPRSTCRPRVFLADKIALIINSGLGVCIIPFIGFPKRIAAPGFSMSGAQAEANTRRPAQASSALITSRQRLWVDQARYG